MAVAERPGRIIRLEVLASWRGLELVPSGRHWDLVPLGVIEKVIGGRLFRIREEPEAAGLTLDEVDAFLTS